MENFTVFWSPNVESAPSKVQAAFVRHTSLLSLLLLALLLRFYLNHRKVSEQELLVSNEQLNLIPNAIPVLGHHFSLRWSPAERLRQWAEQYGNVFLVKLGNRNVSIVNGGAAAREIFARHANALNSRPELWTYHNIFSRGTKATMSSTPFNQLFSNAKKAAPFSQVYLPTNLGFVDLETRRCLEEFLESAGKEIDPLPMLQRMNTSLNLNMTWGRRITSSEDPLFLEITYCEYKIVELRNVFTNLQDGIPLLRYPLWSTKSRESASLRRRRDRYLNLLNRELDDKIARGNHTPCLRTELLSQGDDLADELALLSVTMLAAGVGPTAAALHWGLALLAVRQDIQQKAYQEIMKYDGKEPSSYPMGELNDKKGCPYILAIAQEILRFFTPTRLGLPRLTTKDIFYNDRLIPRNSTVIMNAWACNRDPNYWPTDPNVFQPERWLSQEDSPIQNQAAPPHFTFSLGSRSCAGTALASRLSYIFYSRLISAFKIRLEKGSDFGLDPLCDAGLETMLAQPKDLKVVFIPRNETLLRSSLGST